MGPFVGLIVVAHAGAGLVSSLVNWAVRTKDFGRIAANRLVQSFALAGGQIGFGLLRFGAAGLLLATAAASVVSSISLARAAWRRNAREFRSVTTAEVLRVANRYRRFPLFSSWSALLAQVGLRAPFLMFVVFYGPAIGGVYALAERLCYLPVTLIAGSVGQVFIGEGARLLPDRPAELRLLFNRTTRSLIKIAIAPAVLLMVVAPFVTGPLFGGAWVDAGLFVSILVPMFLLAFVITSTGDVLYIVERQGWQAIREILRVSLLGGSVLAAGMAGLGPVGAVACLSIAGCLTYLAYGAISIWAINSYRPAPAHHRPAQTTGSLEAGSVSSVPDDPFV
jgi:O-antigen/teichoic acid export membrane protein